MALQGDRRKCTKATGGFRADCICSLRGFPCAPFLDPKSPSGDLVFIMNEHTSSEIGLDTGEWGHFRDEMAPCPRGSLPRTKKMKSTANKSLHAIAAAPCS